MSISRIKIIYVSSLLILAVLTALIFFQPPVRSGEYSEVQQEQLLATGTEWIIQFNILNNEDERQNYTINVLGNDKEYSEKVSIKDGGAFAFIHHIKRDEAVTGEIKVLIYREGTDDPLERLTYYLR